MVSTRLRRDLSKTSSQRSIVAGWNVKLLPIEWWETALMCGWEFWKKWEKKCYFFYIWEQSQHKPSHRIGIRWWPQIVLATISEGSVRLSVGLSWQHVKLLCPRRSCDHFLTLHIAQNAKSINGNQFVGLSGWPSSIVAKTGVTQSPSNGNTLQKYPPSQSTRWPKTKKQTMEIPHAHHKVFETN